MKTVIRITGVIACVQAIWLTGCGWFSEPETEPVIIANFITDDDGLLLQGEFDSATFCTVDSDSGTLQARFTSGEQSLAFAIRDPLEGKSTVECHQSQTNFEDRQYIGDGYENCAVMIEATSPSESKDEVHTYELYRSSTQLGIFENPSKCTIEVDRQDSSIDMHFSCEALVLAEINGLPSNPIANEDLVPLQTRSFVGNGRCQMIQGQEVSALPSKPLPPEVASGSLKTEDQEYNLIYRSSPECKLSAESGNLDIELAKGEELLNISIRDFSRSPMTYVCTQAANNVSDSSSVGDLYEDCGISLAHRYSRDPKMNAYSMYRTHTSVRPFSYGGNCEIVITDVDLFVTGEVTCNGMAQTVLNGLPRNPIASIDFQPDVTADLQLTFKCVLED